MSISVTFPDLTWAHPSPMQVVLVAPRRWQPAAGAELAITYGDKSNEELLFHYGGFLLSKIVTWTL